MDITNFDFSNIGRKRKSCSSCKSEAHTRPLCPEHPCSHCNAMGHVFSSEEALPLEEQEEQPSSSSSSSRSSSRNGIVDLTLDTDVKEALLIKKQQVWKYCFTYNASLGKDGMILMLISIYHI